MLSSLCTAFTVDESHQCYAQGLDRMIPPNLYDEMFAVVDALNRDNIDYAVCGGLAVAIHGFVRATRDIDLLILSEDLIRVLAIARKCGFTLEGGILPLGAGEDFPREIHRISKVIDKDLMTLDLLIVNPLLRSAWEAREYYEWHGRKLQAVSPAGLYIMKKLSGRPQDLIDLQRLGFLPDDTSA